ncbi:Extended Synaptotagmin-1 [Manis pentadactyla]|nr:Extended Synaptotagmin-1 [Manis pentadactyla]
MRGGEGAGTRPNPEARPSPERRPPACCGAGDCAAGAGSAGLRALGLGSSFFRGGCRDAGGGALLAFPGTGGGSVSPSRLPCLSASCCPQLRAGRSLPGAVEKFGALVGFLFLLASASLVTGVNTASPRPAAGRYRHCVRKLDRHSLSAQFGRCCILLGQGTEYRVKDGIN